MTAPVFLLADLSRDRLTLTGPEGRHAGTVRRVRVGEAVDLVDGRGNRARTTVRAVARDVVELDVVSRTAEPVPSPRVVLVQAIAKGDRGESAVTMATEAGVDAVVPWAAERSIVKWEGERGEKARQRWLSAAREAGKQSRRAWLPEVSPMSSTAEVADLLRAAAAAFVLHESAAAALSASSMPTTGDLVVVVGPEGGLTDAEVRTFEAAGALAVRLGSSVLRTSTAGVAAVAAVSALSGRWS
ncbi:MAG: 16S rRNA (uracil(1498)-N(3))-methyltransferase [Mycobacteriales bacterium]